MKLTAAPIGLTGAFELKVTGDNPDQFNRELQPTVHVDDYYGLRALQELNTTGNLALNQDQLELVVPNGYIYRVHAVALRISNNATDRLAGLLGVKLNAQAVIAAFASDNDGIDVAAAASGNWCLATWLNTPLLLPPGASVVGMITTAIGAARACSLTLLAEVYQS